jgi:site-specific DNA-methyltransferase (adenine-specific)
MTTCNRVLEGDCTQLLRTLPTESIDLVVTDPPYFVNYRDRTGRTIANDSDPASVIDAFDDIFRVLKPNTFCVSFYGWNRVDAFVRAWRRAGFQTVGHLVWHKSYASSASFLRARHEQAYLLAKGRPAKPADPLDDVRPWKYTGNVRHPTEKDVSILQPLIESFSKPGDLVLDPFSGSGSTLVAAAQAGRRYLGIELEPRYCEIIRDRLMRIGSPAAVPYQKIEPASTETGLQGLWQWLRDQNHDDLASVVQQAMGGHPS